MLSRRDWIQLTCSLLVSGSKAIASIQSRLKADLVKEFPHSTVLAWAVCIPVPSVWLT
jgi:hypothetical protein